jgi:serine/threonine-protein kinase
VLGGPITTAADVYGLGVILYEILTGTRPFRLGSGGLQELERRILQDPPDRPSSVIGRFVRPDAAELPAAAAVPAGVPGVGDSDPFSPGLDPGAVHDRIHLRRLRQELRGDLDRIVLMALRKEPDQRYPSAEALAVDVERYLVGEPVSAQRSSRRYRAAKFIRRNRVQTLAAAAVVAALAIGAGVSTWQARRAERALAASKAALSRSEDVTALLLEMFEAADPMTAGGDTAVAREILRRGLARVEELDDQPLVQAEMLHALGRIHYSLGRYEQSLELFDRSLELRRAYLGPRHPDVVESLERVAWLYRGDARGGSFHLRRIERFQRHDPRTGSSGHGSGGDDARSPGLGRSAPSQGAGDRDGGVWSGGSASGLRPAPYRRKPPVPGFP